MKLRKFFSCVLLAFFLVGLCIFKVVSAAEQNTPFPAYGSGPVEVRIYTDYFCPPCRAMEPNVEALLKDLLRKNAIRLILVDVPIYQFSSLFARNMLYTLMAKNELEQALRVRNVLHSATADKEMRTQEKIEALFKEKGIAFSIWDPKPAFDRYNALIKDDKINATPTCVIIQNGQKNSYIGGPDIINALRALP
jgi:thiol:disulfide interchange protein DsbA